MQAILNRVEILSALNLAAGVAKARTTKPVLACVKLTADADSLTVASTDLEMSLTTACRTVQIERQGETAIPAEDFRNIVAACDGDTFKIDADEKGTVSVRTQDDVFKLYSLATRDFPPTPPSVAGGGFEIPGSVAADAMNRSRCAVNEILVPKTDGKVAFPKGLMIRASGKIVEFVGSDGGWMALASIATGVTGDISSILSPRTVSVILKLIEESDADDTIKFSFSDNQVGVSAGGSFLCASLVEGRLIPYRDVIPKESTYKATVGADAFASSLKRASLMTTELSSGAKMDFSRKGLVISVNTPEKGALTVNVPMRFEGDDLSIGLKPKMLAAAVRAVSQGGDEVTMEMTSNRRPVLMKAGGNYLCVVMPCELIK